MAVSTLFDGTNDNIVSNTGNNLTLGAYTFGMLVHMETDPPQDVGLAPVGEGDGPVRIGPGRDGDAPPVGVDLPTDLLVAVLASGQSRNQVTVGEVYGSNGQRRTPVAAGWMMKFPAVAV